MVKSKKESVTKVEAAPASTTTKPSKKSKRDAEVDMDIKKNPKKQKTEVTLAEKKAPPPKEVETSSSSSDSEEEVVKEPTPVKKQPETLKKDKAESSSSEDESSSSDEESVPPKQKPAVAKKAKAESSSSEDESSSSDEESVPAKKQPTTTIKAAIAKSGSSSEEESSSDEEPASPKKQPAVVESVKQAAKDSSSSEDESDEDSDEESEDEKEAATKKLPAATKSKSDSESSEEDSDEEESDDDKPPTKKAKVSPTKTSKQETSSSDESSEEESEDEKETPKKNVHTDVEMVEADPKSIAKQPKTPTTQARGGSTTIFAGNLLFQVEKSDVENFFKEVGDVVEVRLAADPDGRRKGFGHVEFASAEAAQKALKLMNGKLLLGREIRLSDANARPAPRSSNADGNFQRNNLKGEGSQVKTIYVTSFDKSVSERDMRGALREHFSGCGQITRISLPCDQETGATRGMAYLDLKEEDGYKKALELNGSELGGLNIRVLEAKPRGHNTDAGRFSATRPGRDPPGGRSHPGRRPPGRGNSDRRTPSKPSVLASAIGKKTVFDD